MPEIAFITTANLSIAEVAALVDAVYQGASDYQPVTPESYSDFCREQSVDLLHSVQARASGGAPVGVAILARRGRRGWCGDFGIARPWQGQGLAHRLMEAFLAQAHTAGVQRLQLEVCANNAPARRVYEKAGFTYTREMSELRGALVELPSPAADIEVRPCPLEEAAFWPAEVSSCWEREAVSILAMDARALSLQASGERRAALVYGRHATSDSVAIHHLAMVQECTAAEVATLLRAAAAALGLDRFRVGNEPVGSRLHHCLLALGFQEVHRYLEMVLDLV